MDRTSGLVFYETYLIRLSPKAKDLCTMQKIMPENGIYSGMNLPAEQEWVSKNCHKAQGPMVKGQDFSDPCKLWG